MSPIYNPMRPTSSQQHNHRSSIDRSIAAAAGLSNPAKRARGYPSNHRAGGVKALLRGRTAASIARGGGGDRHSNPQSINRLLAAAASWSQRGGAAQVEARCQAFLPSLATSSNTLRGREAFGGRMHLGMPGGLGGGIGMTRVRAARRRAHSLLARPALPFLPSTARFGASGSIVKWGRWRRGRVRGRSPSSVTCPPPHTSPQKNEQEPGGPPQPQHGLPRPAATFVLGAATHAAPGPFGLDRTERIPSTRTAAPVVAALDGTVEGVGRSVDRSILASLGPGCRSDSSPS